MKFFCLLVLLVLFSACETESADVPSPEEQRVLDAYVDLSLLHSSFPSTASPDSLLLYKHRADSILSHYHLSPEEFRTSLEEFSTTSVRFQQFFKEIEVRLQKSAERKTGN